MKASEVEASTQLDRSLARVEHRGGVHGIEQGVNIVDNRIYRAWDSPKREDLTWEQRWKGQDKGLITCWEVGRDIREKKPELARIAERDELPPLGWKGGVEKKTKKGEKIGTLYYLAQWQGLRGEDLDVDLGSETVLICSKTAEKVIFTGDADKYGDDADKNNNSDD